MRKNNASVTITEQAARVTYVKLKRLVTAHCVRSTTALKRDPSSLMSKQLETSVQVRNGLIAAAIAVADTALIVSDPAAVTANSPAAS
jgi:hypothetical protein